jgi:hypothetical protein
MTVIAATDTVQAATCWRYLRSAEDGTPVRQVMSGAASP